MNSTDDADSGEKIVVTRTFSGRREAIIALNAIDWALVAWDLDTWLRGQIKHGGVQEYQAVRDELHSIIDGYCLSLDMIP